MCSGGCVLVEAGRPGARVWGQGCGGRQFWKAKAEPWRKETSPRWNVHACVLVCVFLSTHGHIYHITSAFTFKIL